MFRVTVMIVMMMMNGEKLICALDQPLMGIMAFIICQDLQETKDACLESEGLALLSHATPCNSHTEIFAFKCRKQLATQVL